MGLEGGAESAHPSQAGGADTPSTGKVRVRWEEKAGRRAGRETSPIQASVSWTDGKHPRERKETGTKDGPYWAKNLHILGQTQPCARQRLLI